jgi:SH3 domain-containing YSC84-like protein 1
VTEPFFKNVELVPPDLVASLAREEGSHYLQRWTAMKMIPAVFVMAVLGATAVRADLSPAQAKRLDEAAGVLRELRNVPDKSIPEDLWNRAACVTVIPGLKKAAFGIGGEYGKGVISCRSGQSWTPPVFIELGKGSAGFQIGAEQIDLVLLMMNRTGVEKLLGDKVNLGADASVAAGPIGRAATAGTDARVTAEILAYSRAKGLFAGIDISGGVLRPDKDANTNAYGADVTSRDVLFSNKVSPPAAAQAFLRTLRQETATSGRKD